MKVDIKNKILFQQIYSKNSHIKIFTHTKFLFYQNICTNNQTKVILNLLSYISYFELVHLLNLYYKCLSGILFNNNKKIIFIKLFHKR